MNETNIETEKGNLKLPKLQILPRNLQIIFKFRGYLSKFQKKTIIGKVSKVEEYPLLKGTCSTPQPKDVP